VTGLVFRAHALRRMFERRISPAEVREVVERGAVIAARPGETRPGTMTLVLERDHLTMVIKHVPAQVCDNCGEEYVDETAAAQALATAERAAREGVTVEIRDFAA
jgi:YgiT-type zinc finger domain-containing protein